MPVWHAVAHAHTRRRWVFVRVRTSQGWYAMDVGWLDDLMTDSIGYTFKNSGMIVSQVTGSPTLAVERTCRAISTTSHRDQRPETQDGQESKTFFLKRTDWEVPVSKKHLNHCLYLLAPVGSENTTTTCIHTHLVYAFVHDVVAPSTKHSAVCCWWCCSVHTQPRSPLFYLQPKTRETHRAYEYIPVRCLLTDTCEMPFGILSCSRIYLSYQIICY